VSCLFALNPSELRVAVVARILTGEREPRLIYHTFFYFYLYLLSSIPICITCGLVNSLKMQRRLDVEEMTLLVANRAVAVSDYVVE
jgi:hypothetical protein